MKLKMYVLFLLLFCSVAIANATVLSECQTGLASDSYTLSADVFENGTSTFCFEITGSDVEIDCNGYSIIGNLSGTATANGVEVDCGSACSNITVKDCDFVNLSTNAIYFNSGKTVGISDITLFNNSFDICGDASCSFVYANDFNLSNFNITSNIGNNSDDIYFNFIYFTDADGYFYGTNTISHNSFYGWDFNYGTYTSARYVDSAAVFNIYDNLFQANVDGGGCFVAGRSNTEDLGLYNIYDNYCEAAFFNWCLYFQQSTTGSHWISYNNTCNLTDSNLMQDGDCINGAEYDFRSTNDSCIGFKTIDTTAVVSNVSITNLSWDHDGDGVAQYHTILIPDSVTGDVEIECLSSTWDKLDFDSMWSPLDSSCGVIIGGFSSESWFWNVSYVDQDIPANYYNSSAVWWVSDSGVTDDVFYQKWKKNTSTVTFDFGLTGIDETNKIFFNEFVNSDSSKMIEVIPFVQSTTYTIDVVEPRINKTLPSNNDVDFVVNTNNESSWCIVSVDAGTTNMTMTNNDNTYFTYTNNSAIADGSYTATFWCNDTGGTWYSTTRDFEIGTIENVYDCVYDLEPNITYVLQNDLSPGYWWDGQYGRYCLYNEFSTVSDDGFNMTIDGNDSLISSLVADTSSLVYIEGADADYFTMFNISFLWTIGEATNIGSSGIDDCDIHDIKLHAPTNQVQGINAGCKGTNSEIYNILPYNSTSSTGKISFSVTGVNVTLRDCILRQTSIGDSGDFITIDSNDAADVFNKIYNITLNSTDANTALYQDVFVLNDADNYDIDNITFTGVHDFMQGVDAGGTFDNIWFNQTHNGIYDDEDDIDSYDDVINGIAGFRANNLDTHNLSWTLTNITVYPNDDDYIVYDAFLNNSENSDCQTQGFGFFNIANNLTVIESQAGADVYPVFGNVSLVLGVNGNNESNCDGYINMTYDASFLRNAGDAIWYLDEDNTTQSWMSVDTTNKIYATQWGPSTNMLPDAVDWYEMRPLAYGALAVGSTEIGACQDITTNGSYILNTSLSGVQGGNSWCFNISSDDVIFDCDGYNMTGADVGGQNYAIWGRGVDNVTVKNCITADWATAGIYFDQSTNLVIQDSSDNSSVTGVELADGTNDSQIINFTVTESTNDGLEVSGAASDDYCNNIDIINSSSADCQYGIQLQGCVNCYINNTDITGATQYGLRVDGDSSGATNYFNDMQINGSATEAIQIVPDPANGYKTVFNDLIIEDIVVDYMATYGAFDMNKTVLPTLPGGFTALASNYSMDISNTSANSWALVNLSYTDADVVPVTEANVLWYRNTSGTWTSVGFHSSNFVDAANNIVSMNATSFSNFAPMEGSDTINPVVTINTPTNITYTSISTLFNITATDDVGMSTCQYEIDGNSNVTLENFSGDFWNATNASMTQGLHQVVFWCNDTSNNWNGTENVYFTIDSIAPAVTINSPTNTTYWNRTILYNITSTDATSSVSACQYELDGNSNITLENFSGDFFNATNTSMTAGLHQVIFWCNDTNGLWNGTENVYFTVNNTYRNVTDCMDLDLPGCLYVQQINITSGTQVATNYCFNVTADDVTYDGNGYWLDTAAVSGNDYGFRIEGNNTLIKGAFIKDYYVAAIRTDDNYTTLFNSTIKDGYARGIQFVSAWFGNVTSNVINETRWGISLETNSNNATVRYNTFYSCNDEGIHVNDGSDSIIRDNTFELNNNGIYLLNSPLNHVIFNNTFTDSFRYGLWIVSATGLNVSSNTFTDTGNAINEPAIYMTTGSNSSTFDNLVISGSSGGIYNTQGDNNNFTNINITNTDDSSHGIYLDTSCGNLYNNINVTNSSGHDVYIIGSTCSDNTLTNIYQNATTFNSLSYGTGTEWYIEKATSYTTKNGWGVVGDYYFDLANETAGWVFVNVSYSEFMVNMSTPVWLQNMTESSVKFWKNVSGTWTDSLGGGTNAVDVTNDDVYANISNFGSIFAPMGDIVYDSTFGTFSVNDTDPSDDTNISVTVNNTGYLGGCIIEHNNTGTFTNETFQALTGTSALCSSYPIRNNDTNLNLIGYYVWVNDTDGAWTRSSLQTYTIGAVGSGGGGGSTSGASSKDGALIYQYDINRKDGRTVTYKAAWKVDNPTGETFEETVIQFDQIDVPPSDIGAFVDMNVYYKVPKAEAGTLTAVRMYQLTDLGTWEELEPGFQRDDNESYYFVSNTDDMGETFVIAYAPTLAKEVSRFLDVDAKVIIIAGLAFLGLLVLLRRKRMI